MKVALSVVVFSLCAALTYAQNGCPVNFVRRNNSCYYFGRVRLNWFDADQYCTLKVPNTYNCHLVALESADEQTWLVNYIQNDSSLRNSDFWMSAEAISSRGWTWASNGRIINYSNWAPGQPDGSGKCAMAWSSSSYRWDDIDCTFGEKYFVCELDLF